MSRPLSRYPTAGWRRRPGRIVIYWRANGKNYEASAGDLGDRDADDLSSMTTMWLRGRMDCPPEIADAPAVRRYRDDTAPVPAADDGWHLDAYAAHLQGQCAAEWRRRSLRVIRDLARQHPTPDAVTPAGAQAWLDRLRAAETRMGRPPSPSTLQRYRSIARRYYYWRDPNPANNPFARKNVRTPRVPNYREIVYLTPGERRLVLRLCAGIPGGLGVVIALYTGMRTKEIAQARSGDISRESMTLHVSGDRSGATNKTGSTRDVPLHPALLQALGQTRGRLVRAWTDPRRHETRYSDDAGRTLDRLAQALERHAARIEALAGRSKRRQAQAARQPGLSGTRPARGVSAPHRVIL